MGTFDIIGHELGHTFLNSFIGSNNFGNASLHEAIGDMLGTYVESVFQDSIDWKIGDDANDLIRDLKNPKFNCFSQVKNSTSEHDRSEPLGHWFYLISEGSKANNIPALGILPALNIVLEALNMLGKDADYADLREKTLSIAEKKFGRCSDQAIAIGKAWALICAGDKYVLDVPVF